MKIREIMTTKISSAEADTTLEEIATLMRSEDIGVVPILDGEELLGVITDRDIVVRCIAEGRSPSEVRADDILTDAVESIDSDLDVDRAAELMAKSQLRRLPVVDNGRLVGMVSIGDIAVKQHDETVSGYALEGVSRGVKPSTKSNRTSGNENKKVVRSAEKKQGISNRPLPEENKRQERVVSIRPDDNKRKSRRKAS